MGLDRFIPHIATYYPDSPESIEDDSETCSYFSSLSGYGSEISSFEEDNENMGELFLCRNDLIIRGLKTQLRASELNEEDYEATINCLKTDNEEKLKQITLKDIRIKELELILHQFRKEVNYLKHYEDILNQHFEYKRKIYQSEISVLKNIVTRTTKEVDKLTKEKIERLREFSHMQRQLACYKKQLENALNDNDILKKHQNETHVSIDKYKQHVKISALKYDIVKSKLENVEKQLKADCREHLKQLRDKQEQHMKQLEAQHKEYEVNTNNTACRDLDRKFVQVENEKEIKLEYSNEHISINESRVREINNRKATIQQQLQDQLAQKNDKINELEKQIVLLKSKDVESLSKIDMTNKDKHVIDLEKKLSEAEVSMQDWQQKYKKSDDEVKNQTKAHAALSEQSRLLIEHNDSVQRKHEEELLTVHKQLTVTEEENRILKDQIHKLSTRLAEEMSQKLSTDERALENVNVKNRPMNIAAEYEMLCSNEWHDAKSILDSMRKQLKEADKIKLLRFIFEASETECSSHLNMLMSQFERMMKEPMEEEQRLSSVASTSLETDIPIQIKVYLGDYWREKADKANTFKLVHKVLSKARSEYKVETSAVFEDKKFKTFVEACVNLAWKMVLQRPPMTFVQDGIGGKWQGDNKQEVFWSSSDPENPLSKVKYYVHPALHHAESLMVKGRVYLSQT